MGTRDKLQYGKEDDDDYVDEEKASKSVITLASSDDEDGNEDLSSKIVEKALSRSSNHKPLLNESKNNGSHAAVIDLASPPSPKIEAVVDHSVFNSGAVSAPATADANSEKKSKKERRKKKKKKKEEKIEFEDEPVDLVKEEEKAETIKAMEIVAVMEPNPVETTDNIVMRKLLRGPRYFDPPDSSWGTCYNCGEEGHLAVNCTGPKRKKPCFICGSLEHSFKNCLKGQDCFICKKGGHRAKDCPEKYKSVSQSSKMCLICGHSGHDMFSCRNDYSRDDLKEIQCYVCNSSGHLCCVDSIDACPREVSCYKCGQLGHTGLACARSHGESNELGTPSSCFRCGEGHFARECSSSAKACARSHGESNELGTPRSCFRCGEEGHFARECSSSAKACARSHGGSNELGTPSSCFRCGEEGHFARECSSSAKACARSHGESTELGMPSSCFRCGKEGHFARECSSSAKVGKRSREYSTPSRTVKGDKPYLGFESEPRDHGKAHKRNKMPYEERGITTPRRLNKRGGWITEDPGDLFYRKPKENSWMSSATPTRKSHKLSTFTAGGQNLGSRSYENAWKNYSGASSSQGSAKAHRGGWITDDPGDLVYREPKENSWVSSATPTRKSHKLSTFTAGSQNLGSGFYQNKWNNSGASSSQGSAKAYMHKFSASRFGNNSSNERTRNYEWL